MATQTNQSGTTNDQKAGSFNANTASKEGSVDNDENEITPAELKLLDDAGTSEPGDDDDLLDDSQLDNADEDGDKLNEEADLTGGDLDIPGSETDDGNEFIGEEDEENNSYSLSDQDDDEDDPLI